MAFDRPCPNCGVPPRSPHTDPCPAGRVDTITIAQRLRIKPATIRQWAARGHIRRRGRDRRGHALYDFWEVRQHRDRANVEQATPSQR